MNADGSLDNTFLNSGAGVEAGSVVYAIALQSDGKIVIGGFFTTYNKVARGRIARLNADGSLDNTFLNSGAGANSGILILALQQDKKILIGGFFTTYNGVSKGYLARVQSISNLTPQTITFAPLADKFRGEIPVTLTATATSGLPVSFVLTQGDTIVSLSGNTVSFKGKLGTVKIKASQAGNATFAAAADVEQSFQVLPPITPNITPGLVASNLSNPIPIFVTVNQIPLNQISKVEGVYRSITKTDWVRVGMTPEAQSKFSATLPPNILDEQGLEYYFEATSTGGQTVRSDTSQIVINYASPGQPITDANFTFGNTQKDYQIIAIPLRLTSKSVQAVLEDELGVSNNENWKLLTYEDGSLKRYPQDFTTIEAGKGYFLLVRNQTAINTGEGSTQRFTQRQPFVLNLKPGYNLIGNPYGINISWQDVLDFNNSPAGVSKLKVFDNTLNSYDIPSDVLRKYKGGFVFSDNAISLKIPLKRNPTINQKTLPSAKRKLYNPASYFESNFSLKSQEIVYQAGGLGMNGQAKEGKDSQDEIALPRLNQYLDISFNHPEFFAPNFAKDVVPVSESHIWELSIESNLPAQTITLNWENYFKEKGNDKLLILYDVSHGQRVNMKELTSYSFACASQTLFRVYYGSEAFVKEKLLPETIAVKGNVPNPFSDNTLIHFALPVEAKVKLDIFDMSGKKVAEVAEASFQAGFSQIEWKGQSSRGEKLSQGFYLARLTIDTGQSKQTHTLKMVLQ